MVFWRISHRSANRATAGAGRKAELRILRGLLIFSLTDIVIGWYNKINFGFVRGFVMKKFIAAALVFVLIVSMLGCTSIPPTRGTVTDGVYTNTYFGLSYIIPDGWRALSDEEYQARFSYALPTNEELAEFQSEFRDVCIVDTDDETDYFMIISYSMLFEKGSSDQQIKNKLAFVAPTLIFGQINTFKIGDNSYSIATGTSEDGTVTTYYFWSKEMIGDFRPLIWVTLPSTETIDDVLAGFSTFTPEV